MSKWISLCLALVVVASSTASAEVIKRLRLVADEQAAPEPAPDAAVEEPMPEAPSVTGEYYGNGAVIDGGKYGKGAIGYGYPFVNSCCDTGYYGSGLWTGYYGRNYGAGCLHRGRCCGVKAACSYPSVQYCDPCATPRHCGLFSRKHTRHAGWGFGKGAACCDTGCGYGFGYGYGAGYAMPYGVSSGCCGGGTVIKGDVIEPAPKEVEPLDAPVIDDKTTRWQPSRNQPLVPTSF